MDLCSSVRDNDCYGGGIDRTGQWLIDTDRQSVLEPVLVRACWGLCSYADYSNCNCHVAVSMHVMHLQSHPPKQGTMQQTNLERTRLELCSSLSRLQSALGKVLWRLVLQSEP